jgi:tetratricopeptide (TPR) repeat protein
MPEWELLVAHLFNTQGVVLWNQYDYTQSREAINKALEIRSKHMRKDDIELIGTKANLASLVAAEGRYTEAQTLYREAEQDHNDSSEDAAAKRLASCRYAATQGRLHTELHNFNDAERELQRSLSILNAGEDNHLYRRAIEYCFGNLRLGEHQLTEAEQYYQSCLDDYPKAVTDKDQIRSCGCHYKLGHIALMKHDARNAA